ncbi:hypothetical protein FLBR109950_00640 [Flavobacterium branchiophilum]|uniref:Uncharacterized protein n=1 Tax=Flavobacterium branchiophilum (strain FL-15) TaxID=1034807 RepID=G2Z096_FLABF|nr:hypothetical protein [Flavobacterium branchiophilum]CCB70729.1 Protein of unknown function [Flavobacterium branchiophilum FL-15]
MEVLINELSLNGQNQSIQDFINTSFVRFIEIFQILEKQKIYPYKKYDFYNSKITETENFQSLFHLKNVAGISDEIKKYRTIADKCLSEPFWEENQQHDSNKVYLYKNQNVSNTSIAEAFERNATLLSFVPSDFNEKQIEVSKENQSKNLINFSDKKHLLETLYENKLLNFHLFCLNYFRGTKLSFENVNFEKSFNKINERNDEIAYLNSFLSFIEKSWGDILAQGGKGKNKVGLAYSNYHDQNYFTNYNCTSDIYKFDATLKARVLGYRDKDVFYVLEFDTDHRLSD